MEKDVFISYSSKERDIACMVRSILTKNRIACWMAPESIAPGSSYTIEIPRGIRECKILLLLLSENAQASPWVQKELDTAISRGKIIIPFTIEKCDIAEAFEFMLSNVQRWNAYEEMSENLERLVLQIQEILGIDAELAKQKETEEEQEEELPEEPEEEQEEELPEEPEEEQEEELPEKTEEEKEDEEIFFYEVKEDYVVITGFDEEIFEHADYYSLRIPEELEGVTVRVIGKSAFSNCKVLNMVNIPDTVNRIEEFAFENCTNLEVVYFPNNEFCIGDYAFRGCSYLELADRSLSKATEIGNGAFYNCENIKEIAISNTTQRIGEAAFGQCQSLLRVDIAFAVEHIGKDAFLGCKKLIAVTYADSYAETYLKENLIDYKRKGFCYEDLEYEIMDDEITIVDVNPRAKRVKIPSTIGEYEVRYIGEYAFCAHKCLEEVMIPETVVSIEEGAFFECTSLQSLRLPKSVCNIERYAFQFCTSLREVTIENENARLGFWAFCGCCNLQKGIVPGGTEGVLEETFQDCTSLTYVEILQGVGSINAGAFDGAKMLSVVKIPKSVKRIEDGAFYNCGIVELIVPSDSYAEKYALRNGIKVRYE